MAIPPPPPPPPIQCFRLLLLFLSISAAAASAAAPIKALIAAVSFDPTTHFFTSHLETPSPTSLSPLILDLDNSNLWRDCVNPSPYTSPTLHPLLCNNTLACAAAFSCTSNICGSAGCYDDQCTSSNGFQYPACSNFTCASWASITGIATLGTSVWTDSVSLLTTDGTRILPKVTLTDFSFLCADDTLLKYGAGKIPAGTAGGTGLSRGAIALPTQISAKIPSVARKFAYCLPSSASSPGVLFFGDGPYFFFRRSSAALDVSKLLAYTPFVPFSREKDSYFLQIQSISVVAGNSSSAIAFDSSLLTIARDKASAQYVGGTRFSSTVAYTQLHPSIYNALAAAFKSAGVARGLRVAAAPSGAPSDLCFDASSASRAGAVPEIHITFKKKAVWRINGANSLVKVNSRVSCLAFQKREENEPRSVIIGTYQQQNTFFQFDLVGNRLGFSASMPTLATSCSNFNFA